MTPTRLATATAVTVFAAGLLAVPAVRADDTPSPPVLSAEQQRTEAGAQARNAKEVYLYANNVNLRVAPRTSAYVLATKSRIWLLDYCQTNKNTTPVKAPDGTVNRWWSKVTLPSGSDFAWVSNVYLRGGKKIAGVRDC
ncbi:peptidase M23 [Streptomyces sp. NBC_00237]|uniref:peptidase M23 n=1 Tax=Streptomyces sp. NBC_00237 TaxID=2975687 RepID=UPI00224E1C78|nr:peptidase M23 [Streptomyces sp. NBC_00237]MCX5201152.1 peptidase M23 [Streptomyces sp. NBC_00237]